MVRPVTVQETAPVVVQVLAPGDEVTVEIERVGSVRTPIVADPEGSS